jgi:hypothetical protein
MPIMDGYESSNRIRKIMGMYKINNPSIKEETKEEDQYLIKTERQFIEDGPSITEEML